MHNSGGGEAMKFKVQLEVQYDKFAITEGKSKSMVNGMQREQAQWAIEDALKIAGFNPSIVAIHKVRS